MGIYHGVKKKFLMPESIFSVIYNRGRTMSEEEKITENTEAAAAENAEASVPAAGPAEPVQEVFSAESQETLPAAEIQEVVVPDMQEAQPAVQNEPISIEPAAEPIAEPVVEQVPPEPKKNSGLTFDNVQEFQAFKARILVIGVGGAGNNTITALTEKGVSGAMTVAVNTDAKHLHITKAQQKVLIGKNLTKGLGAGGYPDVGKNAAMENKRELKELLADTDLVFVTCGLGGGTGTGAAPVISKFAKDAGAIVIAAVTLPLKLEGARAVKAEEGLVALRQSCDTVIAIENQRLLELGKSLPLKTAFGIADGLIASMIKGITETIYEPSLINLDYADVKAIMRYGGVAAIGVGNAEDEDRAELAVQRAMNHPLLNVDYNGAKGAMVHVTGGPDLRLEEVNRIGNYVQSQLDPSAQVIWGARILPEFAHKVQVITIITGVKSPYIMGSLPRKQESLEKELGIKILKK